MPTLISMCPTKNSMDRSHQMQNEIKWPEFRPPQGVILQYFKLKKHSSSTFFGIHKILLCRFVFIVAQWAPTSSEASCDHFLFMDGLGFISSPKKRLNSAQLYVKRALNTHGQKCQCQREKTLLLPFGSFLCPFCNTSGIKRCFQKGD